MCAQRVKLQSGEGPGEYHLVKLEHIVRSLNNAVDDVDFHFASQNDSSAQWRARSNQLAVSVQLKSDHHIRIP